MAKIQNELAGKAAQIIARGMWGNVSLSKGVPIYDVDSEEINAFLFRVSRDASVDIGKPELLFDGIRKEIKASPDLLPGRFFPQVAGEKRFESYVVAKAKMLKLSQAGTVVVSADDEDHPLVMAYEGLSFDLVGNAMVGELRPSKIQIDANVKIRREKGVGHFFGEFKGMDGGLQLLSLLDAQTDYRQAKDKSVKAKAKAQAERLAEEAKLTDEERKIIAVERKNETARIAKLWDSIKKIDDAHMKTINPEYFKASRTVVKSGSSGSGQKCVSGVPDLQWHNGCAPTAAGNLLAYWDTRGYPRLVDDPARTAYDMIDELVAGMGTDSNGWTFDNRVDDGIRHVANNVNLYRFGVDGPDSWCVWGKICGEIDNGRPAVMILHHHPTYGDHSVTVVCYRSVDKDCAPDDRYITIHDTWPSTPANVEIAYSGSVDGYDGNWNIVRVTPGGASNKQTLGDTSVAAPGACSFAGRLNIAWSGTDGSHRLNNIASPADGIWIDKVTLGDTSPNGVSICEFNGKIYMAWSGTDNRRVNVISSGDGRSWSNKVTLGETSVARPMLASHNGMLFLAWTGTDSNQHLNLLCSNDGVTWTSKRTLSDRAIGAPALARLNGRLYIAWTGTNSSHNLNVMSSGDNGANWQNKVTLGDTSIAGPSLLVASSTLYLAWAGCDSNHCINTIESTNGSQFVNKRTYGDSSDYTPQLAMYQGLPCFVWTGRDSAHHLNVMLF
jgi:hypothetical protein